MVDLPGLTKVPVGDQPKDIEKQIKEMLLKFITKPNAIILAVTAANTDLANSDGLKLAREVDPDGLRTIGVLTKIDLMDQGTDVVDILAGRIIPLRLGYVPVVNRGQRDIDGKKAISASLEAEKQFFDSHSAYQSKSQYCGTPFLARKLSVVLMHHIRNTLPEIKTKISFNLQKYQAELISLGGDMDEGGQNMIFSIITEFCSDFRTILDGSSGDISTAELSGGARVSFVFHEIFATAIMGMDAFDTVKDVDIRTLLYNSSGSSPALFVATSAFEVLIKQQIRRLEEPSLKCVTMVFDELIRILNQVLQKPIFKRFPPLKEKFYSSVNLLLKKGMEPANKLVSGIVAAEACYINVTHPDFINGHRAMAAVSEKANAAKQPAYQQNDKRQLPIPPPTPTQPAESNGGGLFNIFSKNPGSTRKPGVLEAPPTILKATGNVSEREFMEIEVIKMLLNSYYNIVKKTVADMVPKATMLNLVSVAREDMQRGLLAELYKPELLKEMFQESESTTARRKEVRKMIEALEKADEIISTV